MYAVAFQQLDYTWAYVHFEQMGTMDIELRNALNKIEKEAGGTIQEVLGQGGGTTSPSRSPRADGIRVCRRGGPAPPANHANARTG